jgi:hypothetical protein
MACVGLSFRTLLLYDTIVRQSVQEQRPEAGPGRAIRHHKRLTRSSHFVGGGRGAGLR